MRTYTVQFDIILLIFICKNQKYEWQYWVYHPHAARKISQHYKRVQLVDFNCDAQYLTSLGGQDDNDLVVWNVTSM